MTLFDRALGMICSLALVAGTGEAFEPVFKVGVADHASQEFGLTVPSADGYVFAAGDAPSRWPERQTAGGPAYTIRFSLAGAPPATGLEFHAALFFISMAPEGLRVMVNGRTALSPIEPHYCKPVQENQALRVMQGCSDIRLAIPAALLRAGANELSLQATGGAGEFYYDVLWLEPAKSMPQLTASATATPFVVSKNGVPSVLVRLRVDAPFPLAGWRASLRAPNQPPQETVFPPGADFGTTIFEFAVPEWTGAARTELRLTPSDGAPPHVFPASLTAPRRWKIYACPRIHNDEGFTDFQANLHELEARNVDEVMATIDRFPSYRFTLESSWLVQNYLGRRDAPSRERMLTMLRDGRLGVNALFLNLLTALTTGEELYRAMGFSLELARTQSVPVRAASVTDVPGHSWALPAILSDAGITGFANGANQIRGPIIIQGDLHRQSPYWWEGADGSRLLTWTAQHYGHLNEVMSNGPDAGRLRRAIGQYLLPFDRESYPIDALLMYGVWGDNVNFRTGHAETVDLWNRTFLSPQIITSTDATFYQYVKEHGGSKLPVLRGDGGSYWEDGAASTALETARANRAQELLPAAETLFSFGSLLEPHFTYPVERFKLAWQNLLFYHEHSWGANKAKPQPEREHVRSQWEVKRRYAEDAEADGKGLLRESLHRLSKNIALPAPSLVVWNPGLRERTDLVEFEIEPNRDVVDAITGAKIPLDLADEGYGFQRVRLLAEKVPPLGYRAYLVKGADPNPRPLVWNAGDPRATVKIDKQLDRTAVYRQPLSGDEWAIESRYYRLRFDRKTGAIVSAFDKEAGRELVDAKSGWKLNELLHVRGGDRTQIVRPFAHLPPAVLKVTEPGGATLVQRARTPFGQVIRIRASAPEMPLIDSEVVVYDSFKRIDIIDRIRKEEVREAEAVYFAFPFAAAKPAFRYTNQNGFVRPELDQLPGACKDWFASQGLSVVDDGDWSVAVATPDAPMVAFTDINRGLWKPRFEARNGHVFSYAMNNYWYTNYRGAQSGDMEFRFSITSGRQIPKSELELLGAETRNRLIAYNQFHMGNVRFQPQPGPLPFPTGGFVELDESKLILSTFKQADDGRGYILRVRPAADAASSATLHFRQIHPQRAALVNGREEDLQELPLSGEAVRIPLRQSGFTTIRVQFPSGGASR